MKKILKTKRFEGPLVALLKHALILCALTLLPFLSFGDPITPAQIEKIRNRQNPPRQTTSTLQNPIKTYCCPEDASTPLFYVVPHANGGYVIMSADSEITPVIAMCPEGDFNPDTASPLWKVLHADLPQRMDYVKKARTARNFKMPSSVTEPDIAQNVALWEEIISGDKYASLSVTPSDVRVSPLIQSTWDQQTVSTKKVYNYYTPSNYPCGCVATAGAQIARYWRYPTKSFDPASNTNCKINGSATTLTTKGGAFDWNNMPLSPTSSITDAQCSAIGKLTYDLGVTFNMMYAPGGSGTSSLYIPLRFKAYWGYKSANYIYASESGIITETPLNSQFKKAILASLDANAPVSLGPDGHAIVGDGYGFQNNVLYIHCNMGWSGNYNLWYTLPNMGTVNSWYSSNLLDEIGYNIHPSKEGEIISGRVLSSNGTPQGGSTITVTASNGSTRLTATPNATTGVYAIWVPSPTTSVGTSWTLSASSTSGETSSLKTATIYKSVSSTTFSSCIVGSSWGNDLTLSSGGGGGDDPDPTLVYTVSPASKTIAADVTNVTFNITNNTNIEQYIDYYWDDPEGIIYDVIFNYEDSAEIVAPNGTIKATLIVAPNTSENARDITLFIGNGDEVNESDYATFRLRQNGIGGGGGGDDAGIVKLTIPAAGGSIRAPQFIQTEGIYKIDCSTRPSWVTGVKVVATGRNLSITESLEIQLPTESVFTFECAPLASGTRSWTLPLSQNGVTVYEIVLTQSFGIGGGEIEIEGFCAGITCDSVRGENLGGVYDGMKADYKFLKKPTLRFEYMDLFTHRPKKLSLTVVKFMKGASQLNTWAKSGIQLFEKRQYNANKRMGKYTSEFIKESMGKAYIDSVKVAVYMRLNDKMFSNGRVYVKTPIQCNFRQPALDSCEIVIDSKTLSPYAATPLTLSGKYFGNRGTKAWIEYKSRGKIKKQTLKVRGANTYDAVTKSTIMNSVTGESKITVTIPKKWGTLIPPSDDNHYELVISTGKGMTAIPIIIEK